MPRNSQGLYTLPAGNPVTPGTLIEAQWANETLNDVAAAMTGSVPRDGSAPMTGPLTLADQLPTQGRHATSKAYVDRFVAYSTGMPVGSVMAYASGSLPVGFLLCDGSLYQKSDYPELEALIGTTYGGTPGQTFKVPDLRDYFIRGRGPSRSIGSTQGSAFGSHSHAVSDAGHAHTFTGTVGNTGNMSANATHSHSATDSGHVHGYIINPIADGDTETSGNFGNTQQVVNTNVGYANISVSTTNTDHTHAYTPTGNIGVSTTGVQLGVAGDTETRPQNIALDYYIKAINDSSVSIGVTAITSSDGNVIFVDDTDPAIPELVIKSNVAFGLAKLDSQGKLPVGILPDINNQFLGYYDASSGLLPTVVPNSGAYYIISVAGTLSVYDPVTYTSSATLVAVGSTIRYVSSAPNPVGWYYVEATSATDAVNVSVAPIAGITGANVQLVLEELHANDAINLAAANGYTDTEVASALTAANDYAIAMAIALG